ncbi:MAG: tetratricopeptide repeat protein [Nitrospira sp.]|nr:tetratricopeptide repeat protein [Nitrospira sp.]
MGRKKRKSQIKPQEILKDQKINEGSFKNGKIWSLALLVAAVTLIVYLPALNNGFVNWDDEDYVYKNISIRFLDTHFFGWIFGFHASNWHPLTWLSHAIDYSLWKLNPMGHHLSNIIFHSLNTFLLSILIVDLILNFKSDGSSPYKTTTGFSTRAIIAGGVTALLFGIHPVHVESVAWVAERKDVLSTFFFLLTFYFYVKYVQKETNRKIFYYISSLFFFILALMSKPMAVTLPVILVITDIYPFQRFNLSEGITLQKKVLIEKIPFFIFSLLSVVLTIIAQHSGGAIKSLEMYPLYNRIVVAIKGLSFYLGKMILPINLSPYYPYPKEISFLSLEYLIPIILLVMISIFCIWAWKRGWKLFLTLWVYYVVTLLPVLGIIQIGRQAAADRYTYIPSIGFFLLIGIGVAILIEKTKNNGYAIIRNRAIMFLLLIGLFCVMGAMTIKQISIWKDSVTLWNSVIERFPDDADAYFSRANAYAILGKYSESLRDLDKALDLNPGYLQAYLNRANVYDLLGKYKEALKDLEKAIKLNPNYPEAYNNRGLVYKALGDYQTAMKDFSRAIDLRPDYTAVYNNRAGIYLGRGDYQSALRDLDKAIVLNPKDIESLVNRCRVHNFLSYYQQAIQDCSRAIDIESQNSTAYKNRGASYDALGRYGEAVRDYTIAISLEPKNYEHYFNRGVSYRNIGENVKALEDFSRSIEMNPQYIDAYNNRGVTYGASGELKSAIKDFNKAIELNPKDAPAYYNRGAAYYRMGREEEAMRDFRKAARLGDKEVQKILKKQGINW